MQAELISIIVPVYNSIGIIDRCIKSIINQTYENIEIILVDDGSTDGSAEKCDYFARIDKRIQVVHKKNGGSTSARNAGLSMARGKFIGFVDSDDWIESDMYERLYLGLIDNDADVCVCRQFLDRGKTSHVEAMRSISEGILDNGDGQMVHHIIYSDDYQKRGVSPNLWDKLFKAELIRKHQRIVDEKTKFAEDDLCVYSALLDANRVFFINKPMYHYCQRNDSITNKSDEAYFEKISLFYKQMKYVFEKENDSEILLKKLDRYMAEFVIRGLNKSFGFGFGVVVPYFIPPYEELRRRNAQNIIIYGAGDVGKDYYCGLTRCGYSVVLWCDQRWAELRKNGYDVYSFEMINLKEYDVILIATDSENLMDSICRHLQDELGVDTDKIVFGYPETIISKLDE